MKNAIIQTHNVHISYNGLRAVRGITLDIPRNNIVALIGASGSGKSTFLRSLNRMLDVIPNTKVEGEITFNKKNILEKGTDVITLRKKIGMVFQNPTPFPKSIYDNIAYGLEIQGLRKKTSLGFLRIFSQNKINAEKLEKSTHRLDAAVVQSLKEAALWDEVKDRLHQSALGLSGGQQQRLCIARAIAIRPDVLLLDEPCSALDPISTKKIEDLLQRLKKDYTIVIVTHNMHQARRISDYVGFFHLGDLIEFGKTKKIFKKPTETLTRDYVIGNFG